LLQCTFFGVLEFYLVVAPHVNVQFWTSELLSASVHIGSRIAHSHVVQQQDRILEPLFGFLFGYTNKFFLVLCWANMVSEVP